MYKTLVVCHIGLFRELLQETLKESPSFTLVGSYGDFEAALEAVGDLAPAAAVAYLTRRSAEEAASFVEGVPQRSPLTRIAFLYHGWEADVAERLIAAARHPRELSFLEIGSLSGPKELYRALAGVASGLALWDRRLVAGAFHGAADGGLSERDLEILRLLASGYSNRGIARRLGLSVERVKASVRWIYEALGIDKANNPEKHPRVLAAALYRQRYGGFTRSPAPSREERAQDRRFRSSV